MWLDRLAARHAHDQLRVGPPGKRRVHRRRVGAAEARVDVGDAEADVLVTEGLDRARTACADRLDDVACERDQLGVLDDGALDRLAPARLDHRARDRVEAAPVAVAERVDRVLRPVHELLHHHGRVAVAADLG